jgi:hypothetical protein
MRPAPFLLAATSLAFLALTACRPAPEGPPNYPDNGTFVDPGDPRLPGPYPYVEGDNRLSVGVWYEGGASENYTLGAGADYFIYDNTYSETRDDDRIEGLESALIELTGEAGFFGGGVSWVPGRDLSAWTTLHISFKSDNAVFDDLEVRMIGGGNDGLVRAVGQGFVTDGDWHSLQVPLSMFAQQGVDLSDVTEPIQLISPVTEPQALLRVDDLYFTDEPVQTTPTDTGPTDTGTTYSTGFLPGPDPFLAGDERLSLGLFYEGGSSEEVEVDDVSSFYYIYDGTYTQSTSDDRIQGLESDAITLRGAPTAYFGGGVTWAPSRDLSAWTRMTISFKATDAIFDNLDVRMVGGSVQGSVKATDHGFVTDGQWHTLTIPMATFAAQGVVLTDVTEPIQLLSETTSGGAVLLVDNLYLDKE